MLIELERFMAEAGIGIAVELLFTGPRVCACHEKMRQEGVRNMDSPDGAPRTYPGRP
jgi:hypothetical protein